MEDFDLLYMMKTPFFLGNFDKAIKEGDQIEINQDDQANEFHKNLLIVRSLTSKNNFPELKTFMQNLFTKPNQKAEVANLSVLVSYIA